MENSVATDTRQRVLKWIEEGQALVVQLDGLLHENGQVRARATTAMEQDLKQLRQENARLRKEQEEVVGAFGKLMGEMLRPMNEMMQKIRGTQSQRPSEPEPSTAAAPEPTESAPSRFARR